MAEKESYRNRQESELQAIQAIYGSDAEDLRPAGAWKPLNMVIRLEPSKSSSNGGTAYAKASLRITCPTKYPKFIPKISIENAKGLSQQQIEVLTQILQEQCTSMKGEEMIYQLAQTVQEFLHTHNKPPTGSLYDQMIEEQTKRIAQTQISISETRQKLTPEQQQIREEVLRRKEMFQNEPKRREVRRSISEASPNHRSNSSSENSEMSSNGFRWPMVYPNSCEEHRSSEILYFLNVGRKIQRGSCLGHSQRGCVAYSGIDLETGQLLYITEWNIRYEKLEFKCLSNCVRTSVDGKCHGHSIDDLLQSLEKQAAKLVQLRHKNIVSYECIQYQKKKEGIVLYLVQDFLLGASVASISGSLGWCIEGLSLVARGVLVALIYLHNQGVSHNHLSDCNVFIDNSGTVRLSDFSLIPLILDLISTAEETESRIVENDLPALGTLIETMSPPTLVHMDMTEFVDRCKSTRTISASDLLEHPFLRAVGLATTSSMAVVNPLASLEQRRQSLAIRLPEPKIETALPSGSARSRLSTEFNTLQWLGKGAFGDVLKVRNILDNREYAIKRIPLTPRTQFFLQRKMTREVELLSRLNHENVVRYYNSWLESASLGENCTIGEEDDEESSSQDMSSVKPKIPRLMPVESSSSSDEHWMSKQELPNDSCSSDSIEFQNSDGEVIAHSDDEEEDQLERKSPRPEPQIMYIQMEFCEKSTLRTAIDDGLYADKDRLWRLFREIAEGLSHIHQQGIIHRDLKPVNIFLDSRDQVKIGDFGLATTSFLALQCQDHQSGAMLTESANGNGGGGGGDGSGLKSAAGSNDMGSSLTGKVGTALYVAPELMENASRATYNTKVDLYSLGIIFFEMCHKPFETAMERHQVITALRSIHVVIPNDMLTNPAAKEQVKVLKWLLVHDQTVRPFAEQLLSSDLLPPAQLEASELQEMLRHALANPQSKAYKHLVSRCLAQKSDTVLELTYHLGLVTSSALLKMIKNKIIALFRKHGGEEFTTPLLWPALHQVDYQTAVHLMTHSGSVVELPHDLRTPFIKTMALSPTDRLRRFSVGRVYREKKVFYFHPKEQYECVFDIITPQRGLLIVDAECIAMAAEIANEFAALKSKAIFFRLNHTSLLQSILLYCNVPADKYEDVFAAVLDQIEGRGTKFHLQATLSNILSTKSSVTQLMDLLLVEHVLGGMRGSMSGTSLRSLLKSRGEVSTLAKTALKELESVVSMAQVMGVNCTMNAYAGLPIGFERCKSGGIVWQMIVNVKTGSRPKQTVLAQGGRYDGMLAEYQTKANDCGISVPNKTKCGVGFTFHIEKIIGLLTVTNAELMSTMDVCVLVVPNSLPRDVSQVLRSLWAAGIRTALVEETTHEEAQDVARTMHVPHVVMFDSAGVLLIRSWDGPNSFRDHFVSNRQELVDHIQKQNRAQLAVANPIPVEHATLRLANSISKTSSSNAGSGPSYSIDFISTTRQTVHTRRRIESQLTQQMAPTLRQFGSNEFMWILVVDLPATVLRALAVAFDMRSSVSENKDEVAAVIERYPKRRDHIQQIADTILKFMSADKQPSRIIALYSQIDASYRVIL